MRWLESIHAIADPAVLLTQRAELCALADCEPCVPLHVDPGRADLHGRHRRLCVQSGARKCMEYGAIVAIMWGQAVGLG